MKTSLAFGALALFSFAASTASAQILWQDDFETDSSADYTVLTLGNVPASVPAFAFDYSAITTDRGTDIGLAPRSAPGDSESALYMEVNNDSEEIANGSGAVSHAAVATSASFSGDYEVAVDIFQSINGVDDGSADGSTTYWHVIVNATGNQVFDWDAPPPTATTDGYMFGGNADNGAGSYDYFAVEGTAGADNFSATPGVIWPNSSVTGTATAGDNLGRDGDARRAAGASFGPGVDEFETLFPDASVPAGGAGGEQWMTVYMKQVGGVIQSKIDTEFVAEPLVVWTLDDPDDTYVSGRVMLQHTDIFVGSTPPDGKQFVLFDNLTVSVTSAEVSSDIWMMVD
ncbi:MAG: hypothetical protein RLY93_16090 [Sumerlaeia bacterium]